MFNPPWISCKISEDPIVYGRPNARFTVMGTVTSVESGEPIIHIRVVMERDTVFTDNDGSYKVTDQGAFPEDQSYTIHFQDIDIGLNGAFSDKDTIAEFKNPEFLYGDGQYYKGEATKEEFNIKLSPKK